MNIVFNLGVRALLMYTVVLITTRLMGRKTLSKMTFFDFVVGITVGSIAASVILGPYSNKISAGIVSLIILTIFVKLMGYLHIKSFRFRKLVNSEPVMLIAKGMIINQNLRKIHFTINELTALLREKNIFNIGDVEYALLEHDGKLSALLKSNKQPLKPIDMGINPSYQGLTKDIIIDGELRKENLKSAGLTKKWLFTELKKYKVTDIKDVFYGGVDSSNNLYISVKSYQDEQHGKYGIE